MSKCLSRDVRKEEGAYTQTNEKIKHRVSLLWLVTPGMIIQRPQQVSWSHSVVFSRGAETDTKWDCSGLISKKSKISTFFKMSAYFDLGIG